MLDIFIKKRSFKVKREVFTEEQVRKDIAKRAEIISEARKLAQAMTLGKSISMPVSQNKEVVSTTCHSTTIDTINKILDKVSKYENSKITTLCELILALETGNDKNLIEFLKKKDKVVKIKTKY